ncbi:hypothetical protein [Streptomyces sp. G7(2002)]|uniref:hypothetical protein n=1 Tax=Streptomyces sp. G7(2002) TaxID=2971798 RepID=UPI00237D8486|nr:hypothetical protein [Streptomyces sp. G7(2002)]WDT56805.1 hypothetical protein NUT86_23635 [Streptomyces sp. G7(2002)]
MNAGQQHLLDTYRAAQRGEAAPPAPGTHTVRTAREIQQWYRFRAVVTAPADRLPSRLRRAVHSAAAGLLRRGAAERVDGAAEGVDGVVRSGVGRGQMSEAGRASTSGVGRAPTPGPGRAPASGAM